MTGDSESEEYTEYRLTDEEFVTILDALSYCRDNALHSDGRSKFQQAQSQMMYQHDHHADDKTTTSERFGGEDDGE